MSGSSPDLDALATMPPQQYLSCFNLEFYMRDLLGHIVERKGENLDRSPLEFMAQYFDVVLRGEHVISRDFQYINSTPLNRRAFVKLLRKGLMGTNSEQAVLTAIDFHDLVIMVCTDFPFSIVEEAARFADKADERKHFPLGEVNNASTADQQNTAEKKTASAAAAEARSLTAAEESGKLREEMYVFASLQRLVEFMFVYSEVFGILKLVFRHGHGGGFAEDGAPGVVDTERRRSAPAAGALNRSQVVDELQRRSRKLLGIAFPSKAALDSLRGRREAASELGSEVETPSEQIASFGAQDVVQLVTFREVLLELSESSELTMEPYPEELMRNIPAPQDAVEVPEPDAPAFKDKQKKKKKKVIPVDR